MLLEKVGSASRRIGQVGSGVDGRGTIEEGGSKADGGVHVGRDPQPRHLTASGVQGTNTVQSATQVQSATLVHRNEQNKVPRGLDGDIGQKQQTKDPVLPQPHWVGDRVGEGAVEGVD